MKIWAKTISNDKITRNYLYDTDNFETLEKSLQEICETIDIPTPIVTIVNENHFEQFNITTFKPRDFVENVDFDLLQIEYCRVQKKD